MINLKDYELNQYDNYYTRNSCSITSLLLILRFNYGIFVHPSRLIDICVYFEKLWAWSEKWWAVFSVIYKVFVWALNRKLKLKFKVDTQQIANLAKNDKRAFWLWIKGYSTLKYKKVTEDWIINKNDIDYLATWEWWVWHNLIWDWNGLFKDTNWRPAAKMSLEVLQYWYKKNLFRNNIRTIEPADDETSEICALCIEMYDHERKWKLPLFYNKYSESSFLEKAKKIYFYWR